MTRVRVELRSGVENPTDYWTQFTQNKIVIESAVWNHFLRKDQLQWQPEHGQCCLLSAVVLRLLHREFRPATEERTREEGPRPLRQSLLRRLQPGTPLKGNLSVSRNADEYAEIMTLGAERLREKYGLDTGLGGDHPRARQWRRLDRREHRKGSAGIEAASQRGRPQSQIIAPSTSRAAAVLNFLNDLETVPGASAAIDTISYHRYHSSFRRHRGSAGIRQRASTYGAQTDMPKIRKAT